LAGLTVAVMLVPQGMAYALLAGMPPVSGLIAATLPLIAYALFGSSRALAVGPVAIVSLMTYTAIGRLATPGSADYLALAAGLALLVGGTLLLLGLLRGGVLVNFLSHAVVAGFTSAAAIVIGLSQLRHLTGVALRGDGPLALVADALSRLGEWDPATLLLGLASIALLIAAKRLAPRFPAAFVVVVLGVAGVGLAGLEVATVGPVPSGLPRFAWPWLSLEQWLGLLPAALSIAFIGFTESMAVARALAARAREHVDPDRELIGLGLANLSAGVTGAFPVTGGFSRSAVNHQAGARSPFAGVVSALLLLGTLAWFTPLFRDLPQAVLGAIVVVAVAGLIDLRVPQRLWRVRHSDGVLWLITFASTLLIGVETGLLLGALAAIGYFVLKSAFPHVAQLGWLPEERVWRNLRRYPEAQRPPGVSILRFDAPLYFANVGFLRDTVDRTLAADPELRGLILDLSNAYDLDASGLEMLHHLLQAVEARGLKVAVAGLKGPVRDIIARSDWSSERHAQVAYLAPEHVLRVWGSDITAQRVD
jgi:SulP family sulfate permease